MTNLRILGTAALAMLVLAGCNSPSGDDKPANLEPACDSRLDGSRWILDSSYAETGVFGRKPDEALADPKGVVAGEGGKVFVFDHGTTQIRVLSDELEPLGSYGGEGRGPGEFTYVRMRPGKWISAHDSLIMAYDGRVLSGFTASGEYVDGIGRGSRLIPALKTRAIHAHGPNRVLLAVEDWNFRTGQHWARVLELRGEQLDTLLTQPLATLPRVGGRHVLGGQVNQASPLWAFHRNCLILSDGSRPALYRYQLGKTEADTLSLPRYETPEESAEDRRTREEALGQARALGLPVGRGGSATAERRFSGLVVDPDGYAWVEPWVPPSQRTTPKEVIVVNLSTGRSWRVEVPEFPSAFGPPGRYYSMVFDTILEAQTIKMYSVR